MLKDTTQCRLWGSNPGPLDSEFDAQPLCLRRNLHILCMCMGQMGSQSAFVNADIEIRILLKCETVWRQNWVWHCNTQVSLLRINLDNLSILASNSSNFWRCRDSDIPTELLAGTADTEKKEKLLI